MNEPENERKYMIGIDILFALGILVFILLVVVIITEIRRRNRLKVMRNKWRDTETKIR